MQLLKNVISYWPNFFREARLLLKYRVAVKEIQEELEKTGLRIDWLGRIYTVINIKEEFRNQPDLVQQSVVFKELKPANDILMRYGLSDYAYPEIVKVEDSFSFLVILYPETDYFNFWRWLWNTIFLGIVITLSIWLYPIIANLISQINTQ
tara:strand:+ start:300 stop:752 length:453 start_codon:yes stop_codon:yes gene_type:complete